MKPKNDKTLTQMEKETNIFNKMPIIHKETKGVEMDFESINIV